MRNHMASHPLIAAVTILALCLSIPTATASIQTEDEYDAHGYGDSVVVTGRTSHEVYSYVSGGSGGGGVTVEGGTGGVFDERAAFMASLSYAMCFGMRMGVNV
ncbi:hypothetical protein [Actinomyces qiguomingii]|uniref:hypothetical protein n=1 Tax=Actinomyces qiguomingii TaxID=2057800 RepID=UPI000FFED9E1|nr:hypothetical protein [Actinomyces qiguomingii]